MLLLKLVGLYLLVSFSASFAIGWMLTIGAENWPERFEWLVVEVKNYEH